MKLQICNGSVSLGGKPILNNIQFEIKGTQKIALVGANGAGKSTLLKLIAGELEPDRDDKQQTAVIVKARETVIDHVHQQELAGSEILLAEYEAELVKDAEQRYLFDSALTGLGFHLRDKSRRLSEFSGGERKKLAIIRLLLSDADVILLDEPDNHLDMESLIRLEGFIKALQKAVVFVSHDRSFIDHLADVVYEIKDGTVRKYVGNYTGYLRTKNTEQQAQLRKWKEQQQEIERLRKTIETFKHKPNKASMARSKIKYLERMKTIEKPDTEGSFMKEHVIVPEKKGAKQVFILDDVSAGYDTDVISHINLKIRRGDVIGILGRNGSGKSTFLKTLTEQIPVREGAFIKGTNLTIGYFDQLSAEIRSDLRVFEYFSEGFPHMSVTDIKRLLASYLFKGEDSSKYINDLSGGEKCRLALAMTLEKKPNVLILDEPTNHMDIPGKEAIESILKQYQGTLLFVTHDRYFLQNVARSLLLFHDGAVHLYPFGYEHYLEAQERFSGEESYADIILKENERLVTELKEVPKPRHIQAKQMGTALASADWELRLVREKKEETEQKLSDLYDILQTEQYFQDSIYQESVDRDIAFYEKLYHETCLEWYEKYDNAMSLTDSEGIELNDL